MGPGQTDGVEKGCNETFPTGSVNCSSCSKRNLWRAGPLGEVCLPHGRRRMPTSRITEAASDKHEDGLVWGRHLEKENMQNIK